MYYTFKQTPAGQLLLIGDGKTITGVHWSVFARTPAVAAGWIADDKPFAQVNHQLDEYFAGSRRSFDFSYRFSGTDFQRAVWHELERLPYGATTSYGQLAKAIGRPQAVRAVGTAVGSNPISIAVPCHRVLSSAGYIGGYAGGVAAKQTLLCIENIPYEQ